MTPMVETTVQQRSSIPRRCGGDRRCFSYAMYIPERRKGNRRVCIDRRLSST